MQLNKSLIIYLLITFFSFSYYYVSKNTTENILIDTLNSDFLSKSIVFITSSIKFPISTIKHFITFDSFYNKILNESSIYFGFIPEFLLQVQNKTIFFESKCFKNNSVFSRTKNNETIVIFEANNPKSLLCEDFYMIANIKNINIKSIWHRGTYQFKLSQSNNNPYVFRFKGSPLQMIYSFIKTAKLFTPYLTTNGLITKEVEKNNLNLLIDLANMSMPVVTKGYLHIIDPNTVKSGDLLAIMRLDGLLPMEGLGMGSGTGHMATALWIDNELYIVESTDKTNYWPFHGIQKNKWFDWMSLAYEANYIVEYLPLSDEQLQFFDEKKAVKWFKKVEGMPYGYNNYLFCWLDTLEDNYPNPLSSYFMEIGIAHVGTKFPNIANKMWNKALCKRLNINLNSTVDIIENTYKQNINFSKLLTIPEMDNWIYDGNYSMVCSVFVCSLWKNAGLFKNLKDEIQCTEFHNWDVYSLNFFNHSKNNCKYEKNRWCHIMGKYRLDLDGANTLEPYPHMAERCPSKPPKYYRPSKC